MSRDPPSFFLSFPSRELQPSPPQMSVSLRLDSILRSVPPTSTTHDALALLSASRLSVFLFPIPFLLSLSRSSSPIRFLALRAFSLPPSCAVSPIADFPPLPLSYLTVFFQLKTTVHTLSVAFCLAQYVASNIYLFSFFFILDLSSSSIFHQNCF